MTLTTFWFTVIAVLWTGFFVLEGFDLGVGMVHGMVGRDEEGRAATIHTIGPLWDGNEVWLIVAGAGMFAAFPDWYATMFSALYLPLVILLVALILRGVSFEFRGKRDSERWRRTWDSLLTGSSVMIPLLLGVGLGNLLHGVPINSQKEFTGSLLDLLNPYSVFVGVTFVVLCLLQGTTFLALKTAGDLRERSVELARPVSLVAIPVVLTYVIWTHAVADRGVFLNLLQVTAVLAVIAAAWFLREGSDGWAFLASSITVGAGVLSFFLDLYPQVMVSSTAAANDLTVQNAASGSYALKVMTVVTLVLLPTVLLYQAWTYHVFRERIRRGPAPTEGEATTEVARST